MQDNVVWHDHDNVERSKLLKQKGCVIWFTGLSGSGKSTIASYLQKELFSKNHLVYILDGDNVRHGLNSDLGFSAEDRVENIRRIGEVSKLFEDCGIITLVAFISPYIKDREGVRSKVKNFIEVHVDCNLEDCESRDPKGLYAKARAGEIKDFTGIDAPYEKPSNPEVVVNTSKQSVEESVGLIINYLKLNNLLSV